MKKKLNLKRKSKPVLKLKRIENPRKQKGSKYA